VERKKILHFRIWSSPPISKSVESLLRNSFPEFDLEVITLWDLLKNDKPVMLRNTLTVIRQYGIDISPPAGFQSGVFFVRRSYSTMCVQW
jgi:hypothetical protein